MTTTELAFTSDTADSLAYARRGWDAVDRMVQWAVEQRKAGSFDELVQILPEGIAYRVIGQTLRGLVADGLVERRRLPADPSGPVVAIGETRTVYVLAEPTVTALRQAA